MNKKNATVGVFVVSAAALFALGLFLIGNQHKAFRRHVEFYTEFANLSGIAKGAKIRVAGMDGGQVTDIQIPGRPSSKFRLKLQVEESLHGLIRKDSFVSIETAGLVGDQFLLIHDGTDHAPPADPKSTLASKEPLELAALLQKASGIMDQAGGTITDVHTRLNGALDAVTTTVNNTNGVVTDIRAGRGTAGVLLEDPATAARVKQAVASAQQATINIKAATQKVDSLITDLNARNLPAKTEETLNNVKSASEQAKQATQQINQSTQQLNATLTQALGEDQYGENAGSNLRQTLSNTNQATGNLAEDTEALKQEFFFRGFFKKRGYTSLTGLPVESYRNSKILQKTRRHREWLPASALFTTSPDGREILTAEGREQVDRIIGQVPDLYGTPLIVEGYASTGTLAQQLTQSRSRAVLLRGYLQIHFHLPPKDIGIVALSSTPPASAGRSTWDGVALVALSPKK